MCFPALFLLLCREWPCLPLSAFALWEWLPGGGGQGDTTWAEPRVSTQELWNHDWMISLELLFLSHHPPIWNPLGYCHENLSPDLFRNPLWRWEHAEDQLRRFQTNKYLRQTPNQSRTLDKWNAIFFSPRTTMLSVIDEEPLRDVGIQHSQFIFLIEI